MHSLVIISTMGVVLSGTPASSMAPEVGSEEVVVGTLLFSDTGRSILVLWWLASEV
jgi:hypothetical protein